MGKTIETVRKHEIIKDSEIVIVCNGVNEVEVYQNGVKIERLMSVSFNALLDSHPTIEIERMVIKEGKEHE